jgi:diguanylate cyclase (GGDEF)-like protein/PAS domain S-box-containing protein
VKNSRTRIILITLFLILAWNIAAWFIAQKYFQSRIDTAIQQHTALARDRASDLADSIQRNLNYVHGIPELFSQGPRFIKVVLPFGATSTPSALPLATRKQRWEGDPVLKDLNLFLSRVASSLQTDMIYVVNAAGDCIAASTADTPWSSVGTNFAERDFFRMNRDGQHGMQYAVGKTSNIAGLYFSSPIMVNGRFMGAVVAKIDVPSLSFMISKVDAFVTDENGVIILAHDKKLEMSSLAATPVFSMTDQQKKDRYRRTSFPVFSVEPWGDRKFPALLRLQGGDSPHVIAEEKVSEFGLSVHVENEVAEIASLQLDSYWFAFLLGLAGTVLIVIDNGIALYLAALRKSQALLKAQKDKLETFLQAANEGICVLDADGRAILANDAFCHMLGYTREEILGMHVAQWETGFSRDEIQANITRILQDGASTFETRQRRKDGQYISVETNAVAVEVDGRKMIYFAERDISERKRIEEELNLASLVLKNSSDGMVVTNADNLIIAANPAFSSITGYTLDEVKGKNPRIFSSGKHDRKFFQEMWGALVTKGHWQGEIWDKRKNGDIYAKWLTISTVTNNGSIHRHVALFSDITDRKMSEEIIWRQANFDTLTDLPNRRMFLDRLQQEIKKYVRSKLPVALMLIDLDQFKEVNDTLGHAVGDSLLKDAGDRIRSCVRETDTVARLGGDEFTVILPGVADCNSVDNIARKIIGRLAEPFQLENDLVYVSASVGITLYPNDANNIDDLMKNADQSMYVAKKNGRNRYSYYTKSLQEAAQKRLRLTTDLRSALSEGQFRVYFQPIVSLASGRIHKAEALIRWLHPERGMVSPMEFIPLAEETGLIYDIGDWVFKESVRWAKHWSSQYVNDFQISVNKSPAQFKGGNGNVCTWPAYLREVGLSGKHIVVEITEGLLLNAEAEVSDKLLGFRDAGIQVAIDDFGTGYSSLSYLKKFDIDYLKIDQTFVRNLSTDADDVALCEAMIVMAHKLGLKVIAEGVETDQQRSILAAAGCDYAQGYLFSQAVAPEELEKMLGQG